MLRILLFGLALLVAHPGGAAEDADSRKDRCTKMVADAAECAVMQPQDEATAECSAKKADLRKQQKEVWERKTGAPPGAGAREAMAWVEKTAEVSALSAREAAFGICSKAPRACKKQVRNTWNQRRRRDLEACEKVISGSK